MIRVQKLVRPNKHSGFALAPKKKTEVRGLVIINQNSYTVYVDKFTRKVTKKKRKK